MSRLALGTVQFGLKYGVANQSGQVSAADITAILRQARTAGLDTLDTAIGYGDSETRLGEAGVGGWKVITKLPPLPVDVTDVAEWIRSHIAASRQRLKVDVLDGLLLHRPADLLGVSGQQYVEALQGLRELGKIRSLGFSIYDPAELDRLWSVWRPDLIQAPCNVLDRRLILSGWFGRLQAAGVRVHVRSVFLQGLLLMEPARRPLWFARWQPLLDRWLSWCSDQGVTPLQAALSFGLNLPGVERVVIGVDSPQHLQQIVSAAAARVAAVPMDLRSDELDLIEPSRWRLT